MVILGVAHHDYMFRVYIHLYIPRIKYPLVFYEYNKASMTNTACILDKNNNTEVELLPDYFMI
jgi:hypothetical protein